MKINQKLRPTCITRNSGILAILFAAICGLTVVPVWAQTATTDSAPKATSQEKGNTDRAKRQAAEKKTVDEFHHYLRVGRDAKGRAVNLETSVTRFIGKNADGATVTVDLIGAVHIGEQNYFDQLNTIFLNYESMLYELVAPEGTRIPNGGRESTDSMNPVAALQLGMKAVLGLEFQLDHIDYMKSNFVHADMSPEEFSQSMVDNEESIMKFFLNAVGQSMAMQSSSSTTDAELMMAMFSSNREVQLRKVFAEQMQNMEASMAIFKGKKGSTIIDHRNAKAMSILKREIDSGKTKLAVFYGAGHLPDMQRRLIEDFGMSRGGQYWLTAWKLISE